MKEVEFLPNGIYFHNYPYPPASVYPNGIVSYSQITEIYPLLGEIRIKNQEILFAAPKFREDLERISVEHYIPIVSRYDVWSLILEPFLDTEFSDEQKERTLRILEECDISREETEAWRTSLTFCMVKYNFESGLWDWCSLDLRDALNAMLGKLSGEACRLPEQEFREFYFKAMELAFRGKPV